MRIIATVGCYGESFCRYLGSQSRLNLARGPNALRTKGGLQDSPPFRSMSWSITRERARAPCGNRSAGHGRHVVSQIIIVMDEGDLQRSGALAIGGGRSPKLTASNGRRQPSFAQA